MAEQEPTKYGRIPQVSAILVENRTNSASVLLCRISAECIFTEISGRPIYGRVGDVVDRWLYTE